MPVSDKQAGFMAMDAMVGLLVFMLMLPMLATLVDSGMTETKKRSVADHLTAVGDGLSSYIKANYSTLQTGATATNAATVTMAQLKAGGHLPATFTETNPWNQQYRLYVLEPVAGELQGIILTTGGRSHSAAEPEFGNSDVPSAAAMAGGMGGFVPTGTVPGQPANVLRGAYGGWSLNISGTNIPNPGAGHLAALVTLSEKDLDQDFLYRVAVPGKPELNQMTTELDMTGHAIEDVSEIRFRPDTLNPATFCSNASHEGRMFMDASEGLYICRSGQAEVVADSGNSVLMKESTILSNGQTIAKPSCPAGTATTPSIFVSPAIVAEGATANALVSVQSWATDLGNSWRVNMRVLTTSGAGWISPPANYGRMTVITTCN